VGTSILPSEIKSLGPWALSLCGGLSDPEPLTLERFMSKIVTFQDMCENPGMLTNPDLVVKVEDMYYNWQTAAPILVAKTVFQKHLPEVRDKFSQSFLVVL